MLTLLCSFLLLTNAYSHSGGTNSSGCHTNHKTGDYHCHGGRSSPKSYPSSVYLSPSTKTYSTYLPQVKTETVFEFVCLGTEFQDPTDASYVYCLVSTGYGIQKQGKKTGIAYAGSTAYDAIKTLDPERHVSGR